MDDEELDIPDEFRSALENDFNVRCREWKVVTDRLRENHVPFWGAPFDPRYSAELRKEASDLDKLLDSCIDRDLNEDDDAADKVLSLLHQGTDPTEFTLTLLMYDFSFKCGAVWNTNSVAYRCNTCAKNSCMSLCADCYEGGGHKDHDSTRFFSLAGGACDCGSEDTLHPSGFCSRHGAEAVRRGLLPPNDILSLTEFVVVKLLMKLFNVYRQTPKGVEERCSNAKECITQLTFESTQYPRAVTDFLLTFVDKGAAARRAMVDILLDSDLYARCNRSPDPEEAGYVGSHFDHRSSECLRYAVETLPSLDPVRPSLFPDEYGLFTSDGAAQDRLEPVFQNFAEEMSFWLVRLNFPQPLIDLTLALTSDARYRDFFARSIMYYYEQSIQNLSNLYSADLCEEANDLIARMLHVSVQICSSEDVSEMLQQETNAMDKILTAAIRFFSPHVAFRGNEEGDRVFPCITGSGNYTRHRQSFWSFLNDLQNFLSHHGLGYQFLKDDKLVQKYIILIRMFQGANTFVRRVTGDHIENDYLALGQRVFSVEYELESVLLMNLTVAVKKHDQDGLATRRFLKSLMHCLETYTNSHDLDKNNSLPFSELSLHLPLHRVFSGFLSLGEITGEHLRFSADQLDKEFFRAVLIHPLRIMVAIAEAAANLWVRNGNTFRGSLNFYRHYVFGMSFFDLDMFLIKYASGVTGPQTTLTCVFEAYHIDDLLNIAYDPTATSPYSADRTWILPMAEATLSRLCNIATFHMTTPDVAGLRRDTLTTLFLSEKSAYSSIVECLCDRGHEWSKLVSSKLEGVLKEVADFKPPDSNGETLTDGSYTVKKELWFTEFDPIYCRMRCFSPKQFEELCLTAEAIEKEQFDSQRKSIVAHFWIPFRLFRFNFSERGELISDFGSAFLCEQKMFKFIGHVIHLYLTTNEISISSVQHAIYLLTLSVTFFQSEIMKSSVKKFWDSEIRERYANNTLLEKLFMTPVKERTVLQLLTDLFRKLLKDESKSTDDVSLARALREQVDQDPAGLTRISGNGIHYVGRLFCLLYASGDCAIVSAIDAILSKAICAIEAPLETVEGDSDQAKRLAMKRKADILAMLQQKSARIYQTLSAQETSSTSLSSAEADVEVLCCQCKAPGNFESGSDDLLGTFAYVAGAPAYTLSIAEDGRNKEHTLIHDAPLIVKTRAQYARDRAIKCLEKKSLTVQYHTIVGFPSAEVRTCGHLVHLRCYKQISTRKDSCTICRQHSNGFLPIVNPLDLSYVKDDVQEVAPPKALVTSISKAVENFTSVNYTQGEKDFYDSIVHLCKEATFGKGFTIYRENAEPPLLSIIENGILLRSNDLRDLCRRPLLFGAMAARVMAEVKNSDGSFTQRYISSLLFPMQEKENRLGIPTISCHVKVMFLRGLCFIASQQDDSRSTLIAKILLFFKHALYAELTKKTVVYLRREHPSNLEVLFQTMKDMFSARGSNCDKIFNTVISAIEAAFLENEKAFPAPNILEVKPRCPHKLLDMLDCTTKDMTMFVIAFMHYTNLKSFASAPEFSSATGPILLEYINDLYPQDFSLNTRFIFDWVHHYLTDRYVNKLDLTAGEPLKWRFRTLLTLPKCYEDIFKIYHNRECGNCERISRHPMLCLVCGQLVCIENVDNTSSEVILHIERCTSGNSILLSVLTSLIIVVQNYKFNIWGSPYLDKHGEEDRQLRRGKPLFLSESRVRFLQRDWFTQVFTGTFLEFTMFKLLDEEFR
uniref:E3 ubiquitin-protein ligase n=1 Tax=Steinernema glaseri TaxID=37863 RepID=A0A1I7YQJ5_9BILA